MPIFAKDASEMRKGAASLRDLIVGHKNQLEENVQKSGFEKDLQTQKSNAELDSMREGKETDFTNEGRGQERNLKSLEQLRKTLPAGSTATIGNGSVSVNPPDPLARLLRRESQMDRADARDDRDLVKLGERLDKGGIPSAMSGFANLESGTADVANEKGGMLTNPDYEVKSAGPVANFLPQWAKNVGESVGLMPQGASNEAALIQRLVNADIKALSGSAVSTHEMGRQNVEKGMSGMGDPALVKLGVKQMQDALASSASNIESSTRPEVAQKYRQQGGKIGLEEYLGKPIKSAPQDDRDNPPKMTFEEYKAAKRAGKL